MLEICSLPAHLDYHDRHAVQKAAELTRDLGMEAYSFHAPFAEDIDITALDEEQRTRSLQEIAQAAEAAALMEVRYFVIHPGPEREMNPPPDERLQRLQNAAGVLNQIARRCRELRIGFVLENMLAHLLFGNTRDMLWIMGAIEELDVGTCLDTGHACLSGDIENVMYKLTGHLQLVHASDTLGTYDDHLPPGEGVIDWHRTLRDLSQTGFRGGLIMELAGDKGADPDTTLRRARAGRCLLRDISKQLELSTPPTVGVSQKNPS
jgi:sugar phosphate isomerase/epimerase